MCSDPNAEKTTSPVVSPVVQNNIVTSTPPAAVSVAANQKPKTKSFKENFRPGNDRCPRCNDRVFYAEKVVANGINWHKVVHAFKGRILI